MNGLSCGGPCGGTTMVGLFVEKDGSGIVGVCASTSESSCRNVVPRSNRRTEILGGSGEMGTNFEGAAGAQVCGQVVGFLAHSCPRPL